MEKKKKNQWYKKTTCPLAMPFVSQFPINIPIIIPFIITPFTVNAARRL